MTDQKKNLQHAWDMRMRLTPALMDEASTEEMLFKRSFKDSDNEVCGDVGRKLPAEGAEVKWNGNELCSLSLSMVSWDIMWKISTIIYLHDADLFVSVIIALAGLTYNSKWNQIFISYF